VLGVVTTYLMMSIIHDRSRQREAVRAVVQSLANQTADGMSLRAALLSARGLPVPANEALTRDSVFTPHVREATIANARLIELDTVSIQLANPDASVRIGQLSDLHTYRASAAAHGALNGWRVEVALHPAQLVDVLVDPIQHERLWLSGVFGLLTVVALIAAAGSSQRQLQLARARSDFIAGVSHELRMPLAQILLAGETLSMARERNSEERAGLSRSIVREARRLVGIVDNVLFFSRSDPASMAVRLEPVDASALFDAVVESVELAVADARQTITTEPGTGIRVVADADLIRHALVNLVDNAIKYGKPAQQIRLSAERTAEGRVRLHVDDEGPGVPAAERERVFDAYERLARDRASERTGTGLGLAIVRRIATACHGSTWIDASPAGGARVTIELGAAT
jgi:signal transduction histidine kinase